MAYTQCPSGRASPGCPLGKDWSAEPGITVYLGLPCHEHPCIQNMLAKFPRAWLPSRECESIRPIRSHPSHHSPYIYPCFSLQGPGHLPGKQSGHQGENQSDRQVSQHPSGDASTASQAINQSWSILAAFSGMGRKEKVLKEKQRTLTSCRNQCQLLMMLVMLGLWKLFYEACKVNFQSKQTSQPTV